MHLPLSRMHSNVVYLHKEGPSKYFDSKILYDKTFQCKVCVVAGERCSDLSDHLKLRRGMSLLDWALDIIRHLRCFAVERQIMFSVVPLSIVMRTNQWP